MTFGSFWAHLTSWAEYMPFHQIWVFEVLFTLHQAKGFKSWLCMSLTQISFETSKFCKKSKHLKSPKLNKFQKIHLNAASNSQCHKPQHVHLNSMIWAISATKGRKLNGQFIPKIYVQKEIFLDSTAVCTNFKNSRILNKIHLFLASAR